MVNPEGSPGWGWYTKKLNRILYIIRKLISFITLKFRIEGVIGVWHFQGSEYIMLIGNSKLRSVIKPYLIFFENHVQNKFNVITINTVKSDR